METMKFPLSKDLEGIRVLKDVCNNEDILLLKRYSILSLRNINSLKNYNIKEVDISVKDYNKITDKK